MLDFTALNPVSSTGFGLIRNKYMSGRVAVAVVHHGGISEIRYYGSQPLGASVLFKGDDIGAFSKLFKLQLIVDGRIYNPEFNETRHFPFGFYSYFLVEDVKVVHELIVLEDAVAQRITVEDNPAGRVISARLLMHSHLRFQSNLKNWRAFEIDDAGEVMSGQVVDLAPPENDSHWSLTQGTGKTPQPGSTTYIKVTGTGKTSVASVKQGFMYYIETAAVGNKCVLFVSFGHDAVAHEKRFAQLKDTVDTECDQRYEAYSTLLEAQTRIQTGDVVLDSALAVANPSVLNLEVADRPGAIRASQDYWVWGWDSLVHADSILLSGNTETIRNMLTFYKETSSPEKGVAHALDMHFKTYHSMAFGAQCLYITTLYNYWSVTGDDDFVRAIFPFCRWILDHAIEAADPETGLTEGVAFYPDYPECVGEDGHDISIINNSLFYQALRVMSVFGRCFSDDEYASVIEALADKTGRNFEKILFDDTEGYWIDSVSSRDGSPRKHYPVYAVLYVSPFACELGGGMLDRISAFMWEQFPASHGLNMLSKHESGAIADGNQYVSYYPSVDRYFWNIMNRCGKVEAYEYYRKLVNGYWTKHTYPEGICNDACNPVPEVDNPGCKQAFAAKAWYCDYLEMVAGITVDSTGISFSPLAAGVPVIIEKLFLRGHRINLKISGRGCYPVLTLNGNTLPGICRIAWDMLEDINTVEVKMKYGALTPVILRAVETVLTDSTQADGVLTVQVDALVATCITFKCDQQAKAYIDDSEVECQLFDDLESGLIKVPAGSHKLCLKNIAG